MPRYLIERTFGEGLEILDDSKGVDECLKIVSNNLYDEVTWVHSYVSDDKSFSVKLDSNNYDGVKNYIDKPVALGIRPENIYNKPDDNLNLKKHRVKLEVAEPMGNETILYFRLSDSQFIARVPAIEKPQPGIEIDIYFNLDKLHFFSLDDGKAIR
ncbi:MAG: TOBE domain-containing protein [Bacteroidetes bacterium]|nr:TOBE domain-containing protein [Bacteroidota bacterium]